MDPEKLKGLAQVAADFESGKYDGGWIDAPERIPRLSQRNEPIKIASVRTGMLKLIRENRTDEPLFHVYRGIMDAWDLESIPNLSEDSEEYWDGWHEGFDLAEEYGKVERPSALVPKDDQIHLSPYDSGFEAFCQAIAREENPYDSGTGEHDQWDQGWFDAEEDLCEYLCALEADRE